jgi:Bacterial protein of unknown function (DUF899)
MKLREQLRTERAALPWVKLDKAYVFDGPDGEMTFSDLFAGRSQLFIKHFMMRPGATDQCVGCSLSVDHFEGLLEHLENHDVAYAIVARAPIEEIEVVRRRMGWRFLWVSSHLSDFTTTSASHSPTNRSRRAACATTSKRLSAGEWGCTTSPARACSSRTRKVRFSIPTRPTAAAWSNFSGSTASSMPCRKGETSMVQHIDLATGRDPGTCTAKAARSSQTAAITPQTAAVQMAARRPAVPEDYPAPISNVSPLTRPIGGPAWLRCRLPPSQSARDMGFLPQVSFCRRAPALGRGMLGIETSSCV